MMHAHTRFTIFLQISILKKLEQSRPTQFSSRNKSLATVNQFSYQNANSLFKIHSVYKNNTLGSQIKKDSFHQIGRAHV